MRRKTALFTAALLLAAMFAPATAARAAGVEIGFEDGTAMGFETRGTSDEQAAGTGVLTVADDQAHSGQYSLLITDRVMNWNGPALRVDQYIEEGVEYLITAWVKIKSPASDTFILSTQIGEGSAASYINITRQAVGNADGWVEFTGKYMYTSNGDGFVTIYVESSNKDSEYYIDDVSFTPGASVGVNADLTLAPLKDIYQDYFLIGNIFSSKDLSGARFDMLKRHYNALTAENAMKPGAMRPRPGEFAFEGADGIVRTALDEGFVLHGHTLAWHQQSADWLNMDAGGDPIPRAEAERNLIDHVKTIVEHYKGQIASWDVLNEAMVDSPTDPENWRSALRNSPWMKAFAKGAGDGQESADYIELLFRTAREADPDAILYYNDYNLDDQNKAIAVAAMTREINDKYKAEGNTRNLIDGIGMQGHYNMGTDMAKVESSLSRFAALGVEISITELDITVPGVGDDGLTPEAELGQALKYAELFAILKKHAESVARVTFWGLDDASSWRAAQYPQLFNGDLSAKLAYQAVADPEGFLKSGGAGAGGTPEILRSWAAYGTPALGGEADALWGETAKLPVEIMLQAWQTASGTGRVLWDEDNLYVRVEVTDDSRDNSGDDLLGRDSVEVFVDEGNRKAGGFGDGDGQYRVGSDGKASFGKSTDGTGFESFVQENGSGYTVEMKIPFKTLKPEANMLTGFDLQINDASDGQRTGVAKWCDPTGNSAENTSGWGVIALIPPEDDAGNAETAPAPEPIPTPASPNTAEAGESSGGLSPLGIGLLIAGGVLVVGIGAFLVIRKTRS